MFYYDVQSLMCVYVYRRTLENVSRSTFLYVPRALVYCCIRILYSAERNVPVKISFTKDRRERFEFSLKLRRPYVIVHDVRIGLKKEKGFVPRVVMGTTVSYTVEITFRAKSFQNPRAHFKRCDPNDVCRK